MRIITLKVEGIEKNDRYERDFELRSQDGVPTLFCTRCGREIKNNSCLYDEYGHKNYRIIDENMEEKMFDDRVGILITNTNDIKGIERKEGIVVKLLATGENVSLSLLQAEPGTSFEIHDHEEEELSYIAQGKAVMTVGDKDNERYFDIVAPTVIKIPPHTRHGLTVIADSDTLIKINAHSPPRKS